jgi:hypothetical protein
MVNPIISDHGSKTIRIIIVILLDRPIDALNAASLVMCLRIVLKVTIQTMETHTRINIHQINIKQIKLIKVIKAVLLILMGIRIIRVILLEIVISVINVVNLVILPRTALKIIVLIAAMKRKLSIAPIKRQMESKRSILALNVDRLATYPQSVRKEVNLILRIRKKYLIRVNKRFLIARNVVNKVILGITVYRKAEIYLNMSVIFVINPAILPPIAHKNCLISQKKLLNLRGLDKLKYVFNVE